MRGAAVVGGVFLALAAIFFFKHAFTQGWISPEARVLAGLACGAGAIVGASRLRRRGFGWATSALEGAGVVALYAAVWAADQRYALISQAVSFPAMALVTALGCALALRHGSLLSALLALSGGFLTPVLLATGEVRTVPLFAYLLLLDLGLIVVARRRNWPGLALGALAATFAYEVFTVFLHRERPALFLPIAAALALVFAVSGARLGASERLRWLPSQAFGVLLPLVLALRYAHEIELGPHLWPAAAFVALLVVAAALVARQQDAGWLALGAALGGASVGALWVRELVPERVDEVALELVLVAVGLALVSHALAEWEHAREPERRSWRESAAASAGAWALVLLGAALTQRLTSFPELALGITALAALLLRQARAPGLAPLAWGAGLALGLAFGIAHAGYSRNPARIEPSLPDARVFWCLPLACAAGLLALTRFVRSYERTATQAAGALLLACTVVATSALEQPSYAANHPWLCVFLSLPFGGLALLVAGRLGSSAWTGACACVTATLTIWAAESLPVSTSPDLALALALTAGPALVLVLAPSFTGTLGPRRFAWAFLAALAATLYLGFDRMWMAWFGERADGAAFAAVGLVCALSAWRLRRRSAPNRAVGWLAAASALGLASAVADRLDHAEFAVSCALFAAALAWIARRLELGPAAWVAAASGALATLTLVGMTLEPGSYAYSSRVVVNWIAYDHLVPAAALVLALLWLPATSAPGLLAQRRAVLGACVLVLVFLWINWAIENAFTQPGLQRAVATAEALRLNAVKSHARDLTTSLAWGVYASALLVLGTARHVSPLRWASLAVFVLSIGKVFLHDLAHLDGLWRVASLAGLALSLIAVSLFYQRFVFGKTAEAARA